ncbi:putative sulfoacetate transporter SauU [subsurface metagenome]
MLAHFSHHLLTALPVPLLPFIRDDFALDYTRSGLVISAFGLAYGFGQLPAGWLADRIGRPVLITIAISGVALSGLLVGVSQTYIMMLIFLVLMGVVGGGYHPASPPLITASVEPKNQGRALGFHMIGGSASFFVVPFIVAAIAPAWGWRGVFIALGLPVIVFGMVLYVLLGRCVATKKAGQRITSSDTATLPPSGRWHHLVSFIILTTFNTAVMFSVISFVPLFMVDHFGVSRETAAVFLALIFSSGLWASPLGGYLSDRLGTVPVVLVVCFIGGPAMYLLNLVPYGLGIGALLVILGIINYVRLPVSEAYIVGQTSERHRSTVLGFYYFGGLEGSGVLTPVIGYLIDQFGFYLSFTIAGAAVVVVTFACAILLWGGRD